MSEKDCMSFRALKGRIASMVAFVTVPIMDRNDERILIRWESPADDILLVASQKNGGTMRWHKNRSTRPRSIIT
jgi:hypothetical protein